MGNGIGQIQIGSDVAKNNQRNIFPYFQMQIMKGSQCAERHDVVLTNQGSRMALLRKQLPDKPVRLIRIEVGITDKRRVDGNLMVAEGFQKAIKTPLSRCRPERDIDNADLRMSLGNHPKESGSHLPV